VEDGKVKRVAVEKVPGAIWVKTGYLMGARIKRTLLEPDCEWGGL